MAMIVPDEPMGRIRRSPYIKTQQEMDVFIQWCKDSEYKVVRGKYLNIFMCAPTYLFQTGSQTRTQYRGSFHPLISFCPKYRRMTGI